MGLFLKEEKQAIAFVKKLLTIDEEGGSFSYGSCGAITNSISGVVYFRGDISKVRQEIHTWLNQEKVKKDAETRTSSGDVQFTTNDFDRIKDDLLTQI